MTTSEESLVHVLNRCAEAFDKLCRERHEAGAAEYGQLTFLENDIVRMMLEELADTTNYCRMQAIKLLVLQGVLEEEMREKLETVDTDLQVNLGAKSFKGTKPMGWDK